MKDKIKVTTKFFASLKETTKKSHVEVELPEGSMIFQLLEALFELSIPLKENIMGENGDLKKMIIILRNGRNIKFLDGLETTLSHGDVVALFPPVAGGGVDREDLFISFY